MVVRNVLVLCGIISLFSALVSAQQNSLLVADFNSGENITNPGEGFGAWDKDPLDLTQGCKLTFAKDDAIGSSGGKSVQLDYDVDSTSPAYNGFWLKLGKVRSGDSNTLSFYVKGDSARGFTPKVKVEIKFKSKEKAVLFVENITDQWQKFSIDLDALSFDRAESKPFEEFVVVFDDMNSRPKTGRILVDQIELSKVLR